MTDHCGRPTKKGGICPLQTLITGFDTPHQRRWPACYNHLTAEERAAYVAVRKATQEDQASWWQVVRPACWAWPVAEPFETWTSTFDVGPEDHQHLQESAADLRRLCEDPEVRGSFYMSEWQDGRCAICARRGDLIEDHDHETGLVRGLLCRSCNTREGLDRGTTGPFAKYRERNPASMLGIRVRYWDGFTGEYARPADAAPQSRAENPWLKVQAKRRSDD